MGTNTINNMLSRCADKKLTNHSARKTTVRKLKSAGFPKSEIKNITGHSSEKGLDAYDSGNENDMCAMSAAISLSSNNINEAVNKSTPHASTS